jgi:hypothetical protein
LFPRIPRLVWSIALMAVAVVTALQIGYPIGEAARLFAREATLPTEYHEHKGQGHVTQRVWCHGSALNSPQQHGHPADAILAFPVLCIQSRNLPSVMPT